MLRLQCIKEGSKLRVRILSQGYYNQANCQFPRDMRVEGRFYEVPRESVALITSRGKYFYSITKKSTINVLNATDADQVTNMVVYEDDACTDCAICMSNPKCMVIVPCGHFYTCEVCTVKIMECPICRSSITKSINKAHMD